MDLKKKIADYVLMMHGAPAKLVPLNNEQVEQCVDNSLKIFESCTGINPFEFALLREDLSLIQEAAYAYSVILTCWQQRKEGTESKESHKKLCKAIKEIKKYRESLADTHLPLTENKTEESGTEKVGLLIFYINVGQMSPTKANAYIERFKENTPLIDSKKICEVVFIAIRNEPTRVEYIKF